MEYIYLLDMVWKHDPHQELDIKYGTIVYDVKHLTGYNFLIKGREKEGRFHCFYQWAFAENTRSNRFRIFIYEGWKKFFKLIEKIVERKRKKIIRIGY